MPAPYNPHTPATLGLEWWPTSRLTGRPLGSSPAVAASLPSTVAESVSAIGVHLRTPQTVTGEARVSVDVYDGSVDRPWARGTIRTSRSVPAADGQVDTGKFTRADGNTSNLYVGIDEQPVNRADYVAYAHAGPGSHKVYFRASGSWVDADQPGAAPLPIAGRRILSVSVHAVLTNRSSKHAASANAHLLLDDGSGDVDDFGHTSRSIPPGRQAAYSWTWSVNPATGFPWFATDPAALEVTAPTLAQFGLRVRTGPTGDELRIAALWIEVEHVDETRVATGRLIVTRPSSSGGWYDAPMLSPADGAPISWAKAAGRTYYVALTRPSGFDALSWSMLGGDVLAGYTALEVPCKINGSGIPDTADQAPVPIDAAAAVHLDTPGGALSPDSQPYARLDWADVSLGHTVEQEVTAPGTGTYGIVAVAVRGPDGPTAPLALSLVDRVTDAVVAGPALVAVSELPAASQTAPVRVDVALDTSVVLTGGRQYAIRVESQTDADHPWQVRYASADGVTTAVATYGSTVDVATLDGTETVDADVLATLAQVPVAPAVVNAVTYTRALDGDAAACGVPTHDLVYVTWTASGIAAGSFAWYEVARADTMDTTYRTIAYITAQASAYYYDAEARRNVPSTYRVRTVRVDGATSDWTETTGTVTPVAAVTDLVLTTNAYVTLTVAYQDETPHEWDDANADDVVRHKLYGVDYFAAFAPLENRGDLFRRRLIVEVNRPDPDVVGRAVFDPLLALAHAQVPYVAILDGDGRRWYASVKVGTMTREEPGGRYTTDIDVAEVTGIPAPSRAQWSPVGGTPSTYGDETDSVYGDGTYAQ